MVLTTLKSCGNDINLEQYIEFELLGWLSFVSLTNFMKDNIVCINAPQYFLKMMVAIFGLHRLQVADPC
jgi:hypothetical protein